MKHQQVLIALTSFALALTTRSVSAETLGESVRAALQNSPPVMKSIARTRGAAEDINSAKSRLRPNVLIDGGIGPAFRDRSVDGVTSGTGETLLSKRASVTVQQMLVDWGASSRFIKSAKLKKAYEELLTVEAREEQALLMAETYMNLIGARLRVNVLASKVEAFGGWRAQAVDRKNDGNVPISIIDGKVANARADYERATGQVEALEARFRLICPHDPGRLVMPPLPRVDVSSRINSSESPGVVAAEYSVRSSQENAEALRKDFWPTLSLELRAGLGEDVLGIEGPDNELSALAVLRWNPLDGGRKRAAIAKAQAQVWEEQAIVADIRRTIDDRAAASQAQLRAAYRRYDELSRAIGQLNTSVSQQLEAKKAGDDAKVTPLSMVSLQSERSDAQIAFVEAQMDRYVSAYVVLSSAGQLLDYFGIRDTPPLPVTVRP